MLKQYSIGCKYFSSGVCTHVDQPFGNKPSGGVCAKKCHFYDGPPATCNVVDEYPVKPSERKSSGGCSGCGSKGKSKPEPIKHDPAEAARILNDTINNPDKESENGKEAVEAKPSVDEERERHAP
jgi:hypothetical protein